MNLRKPPALATRLLGLSHWAKQNPSLMGDLLEEYQAGRSSAWYWRQIIRAIAAGFVSHPSPSISYVMGVLLGWILQSGLTTTIWLTLPSAFYEWNSYVRFAALLGFTAILSTLFEKLWKLIHLGTTPFSQATYRVFSLGIGTWQLIFITDPSPASLYTLIRGQILILCAIFVFEMRNIIRGAAKG